MRYTIYPVLDPLTRFVSCAWSLESDQVPQLRPLAVPAYGCVELIVHLAHPFAIIENGIAKVNSRALLIGHLRGPIAVQAIGPFRTVGVRFRPGGHFPFFPIAGRALDRQALPLNDVLPRQGDRLAGLLAACCGLENACGLLQSWMLDQLNFSSTYELADAAVSEVLGTGGQISVTALSAIVGVGRRSLERNMLRITGLRPKELCRVIRFTRVLKASYADPDHSWTSLATDLGFYDQAHLIRDFRQFAGSTPSQYARQPSLAHLLFATADKTMGSGTA